MREGVSALTVRDDTRTPDNPLMLRRLELRRHGAIAVNLRLAGETIRTELDLLEFRVRAWRRGALRRDFHPAGAAETPSPAIRHLVHTLIDFDTIVKRHLPEVSAIGHVNGEMFPLEPNYWHPFALLFHIPRYHATV